MNRSITVRLPEELHRQCKRVAQQRKTSMNAVFLESLRALIEEENGKMLYEAFSKAGEDADTSFALSAQKEILDE